MVALPGVVAVAGVVAGDVMVLAGVVTGMWWRWRGMWCWSPHLGLKDTLSGRRSMPPVFIIEYDVSSPIFDKSDFTSVNIKFDIVKIERGFNRITVIIEKNHFLDYICGPWWRKSWNKGIFVP